MIGRTYLERGQPVVVLKRWGSITYRGPYPDVLAYRKLPDRGRYRDGPRNVLIRRADGSCVVRPFRGLRKIGVENG